MKKILVYIVIISFAIINCGYIEKKTVTDNNKQIDSLYSLSAVLIDADSGRVLYSKNGDEERPMASTTKIMTLILALEYGQLEDVVTVSSVASKMPEVKLGINEGEQYRLKDLLYSLILESHNDTAVAIAEHIGGSVDDFAVMMNTKAKELGLYNTYFITPNGLDAEDENGVHHTTAIDLARLMQYCVMLSPMKESFREICATREYQFTDYSGKILHYVRNKNAFLDMMDGAFAGKTGFTGNAGYCYVGALNRGDKTFIVALLGCGWPNNRGYKWIDSRKLLEYGINNYSYRTIIDKTYTIDDIQIYNGIDAAYEGVYIEDEITLLLADWDEVEIDIDVPDSLEAPIYKGENIGCIRINVNGKTEATIAVYAQSDIRKKNYKYYFKYVVDKFIFYDN